MSLKSPLGKVLGLGSAGSGTEHWWAQRLTAVAMVPLTLWFAISLLTLPALDFYTIDNWVSEPLHAVLLLLLLVAVIYHSSLGTQVVVEDYVHHAGLRVIMLAGLRLAHIVLAVAGAFAVVVVSAGVPA